MSGALPETSAGISTGTGVSITAASGVLSTAGAAGAGVTTVLWAGASKGTEVEGVSTSGVGAGVFSVTSTSVLTG